MAQLVVHLPTDPVIQVQITMNENSLRLKGLYLFEEDTVMFSNKDRSQL